MAAEMTNIEIRDFMIVSGVENADYVILSLFGGTSAKMAVGLFQSTLTQRITPSIRDGMWWIGEVNQEVVAEGQTPQFRKSELGIEWKYTNQPSSSWTLLVPISEILFKFEELTESQRELITLKFSDLTAEEIAELQQPANDMIAILKETDDAVNLAEAARVEAEKGRVETEKARVEAETKRAEAETERDAAAKSFAEAEDARQSNETERDSSESERKASETERVEAENIRVANEQARISREEEWTEAENERVASEKSRVSAEEERVDEFARLKSESEAATADARETATHPTYVGEDSYVYEWNSVTKTYDKTSKYVRGEPFSIKKVYESVSDMYADNATVFKEGDFALIDTGNVENPENGQLFVRSSVGSWDFLVDMSGAIGFTGKTPQLLIGSVLVGSGKASASVAVTPDGEDSNGNPVYRLNYTIPCLAYEDLTDEQIAELQRPANEMIARLQATDDAVKASEALRVSAEEERASEFARLKNDSETATAGAIAAVGEANDARDAANSAAVNANTAASSANESAGEATQAAETANEAALKARNLPKIQDGTWWLYDVDTDTYVDSGYAVSSDYQLTKEKVENVLTGDIKSHWHDIYINKVEGKGLSTEDFTTALKEKLESLENYDDTELKETIAQIQGELETWGWGEF